MPKTFVKRKVVMSSNISVVEYNAKTTELFVTFNGGKRYVYYDVPPDVANTFMEEPEEGSYGKHFSRYIKNDFDYAEM